ncbi:hypothetical protein [Blastococcus sp. SYSU D00820]
MIDTTRLLPVALAGVTALVLTACGGGAEGSTTAAPTSSAAPAPAAEEPRDVAGYLVEDVSVPPAPTDPRAASLFGEEAVEQAWLEAVQVVDDYSYDPALFMPESFSAEDFAGLRSHLTERSAADWDATVSAALAAGTGAGTDEWGLIRTIYMTADWGGAASAAGVDVVMPTDGPFVTNRSLDGAQVAATPDGGGLVLSFTENVQIRFMEDGQMVRYPIARSFTFTLVPAPGGSAHAWLIDHFTGDGEYGEKITEA